MYAKVLGSSILGIDGFLVEIEVDLANGLPQFQIVGLPDSSIRESKDRVRAAIKNSGYSFPIKRITINLAPADIKKEGSGFDLPMAIGILIASEQIDIGDSETNLEKTLFIGELSLDGSIHGINGILPMAIEAKQKNIERLILPNQNVDEARLVQGIEVFGFSHLQEVIEFLTTNRYPSLEDKNSEYIAFNSFVESEVEDFIDVKGHVQVKRAIEVAVAGMHNLLMIGPPGSGKSMIAKRIPSVLPLLTWDEMLEVTKIYSVAGELNERGKLMAKRPFRQPHHSISAAGLIGGGSNPKPGEISLAHRGILFLDELPEFPRHSLESMRQPLEDGKVTVSRARATYVFPSQVMLVGAMNPCKCGYYGTEVPGHECQCTPLEVQRYRSRLSGPLLDRIDIHIEVPWMNIETLREQKEGKSSQMMRETIERARMMQKQRFANERIQFNSEMNAKQVKQFCQLEQEAENLLRHSFDQLGFSGRSLDRILKISRTIADFEESETIKVAHLAEAINYRVLDRRELL
ncbi:YifB family Mg chelatase-like AAA ATPase [Tepidibacillus fermentans]|uniref:Magnesium chelatase family protein n=1 Tax=Tepidibacillus fermentans TaxID=1281767 RepID=A0A4R3KIJ7_9BACI|nr:YifB family Mg chelatase-like AAA ATPase [Tepidibacillus fermentans]TCS82920.1 magnesium chelatase family protein [Tepidibacillus fermentans]